MRKNILYIGTITLFAVVAAAAGCGSANNAGPGDPPAGKTIATGSAGNNLTVTLSNADGVLRKGKQEFSLTFTDSSRKTVDVGAAGLNYRMAAMGSMSEMNNAATLTTTGTPGVYSGKVNLDMAGEWQAQITYEGPAGKGKASLPISAQ